MKRNAWTVLIPGQKPLTMAGGEPITHDEALAAARIIWPDAQIAG